MKLIFMGTPDFAVPALKALVAAGHEIVAVYSQPPRPAGRGQKPRQSPVHVTALDLGLQVLTPASLKGEAERDEFRAHGADAAVVAAYGLILPPSVLAAVPQGCINIHASMLPRWRGAAPIHRAIMAGDSETGISIMQMEPGLDTGPVLLSEAVTIGAQETTGALHDRLSDLGARLITQVLADLPRFAPSPQPAEGVTYAHRIDKAEAKIDFTKPAEEVDRQIRGLSPFPGAFCLLGGERIKLLGSRLHAGKGAPGDHLGGFVIACGSGAIEVLSAQREGKRALSASEVLLGLKDVARFD